MNFCSTKFKVNHVLVCWKLPLILNSEGNVLALNETMYISLPAFYNLKISTNEKLHASLHAISDRAHLFDSVNSVEMGRKSALSIQ